MAVTWKAKPGREAEVAEIFRKLTAESRKEAGCLMYRVQRQQKDASRFFVYEQYRNQQALEAHRNAPHFLEYARKQPGARVFANHPMGPTAGTAFNVTVLSYRDSLDLGLVVDTAAVDDPELLRSCIARGLEEIATAPAG